MFFQPVQQCRSETEVSLLKVFFVLGAVHASQMEDEIALLAVSIQLCQRALAVEFIDFINLDAGMRPILAIPDVLQILYQVPADESG